MSPFSVRISAEMPGMAGRRSGERRDAGQGAIAIAPVSVCRHVSTADTGRADEVVMRAQAGIDRFFDAADQPQRRHVVRFGTRCPIMKKRMAVAQCRRS